MQIQHLGRIALALEKKKQQNVNAVKKNVLLNYVHHTPHHHWMFAGTDTVSTQILFTNALNNICFTSEHLISKSRLKCRRLCMCTECCLK